MIHRIVLSYDGTSLSGWQIQPNAPSVQEILSKALSTILREEVEVVGAGRTDACVNAVGYVGHFEAREPVDAKALVCKLNAILPSSVIVHEVREEAPDFHARFSATERGYMYFLHRKRDPFVEKFSYRFTYPGLDVGKMNEACSYLLGTQDFSCFEKTGGNNKTSTCTIKEAFWRSYEPTHVRLMGYPAEESDYLVFTIRADRFLRNMVRAVVGTLLDIGRGKHEPEWMKEVLLSGNRGMAGESVPGHALFLMEVKY